MGAVEGSKAVAFWARKCSLCSFLRLWLEFVKTSLAQTLHAVDKLSLAITSKYVTACSYHGITKDALTNILHYLLLNG